MAAPSVSAHFFWRHCHDPGAGGRARPVAAKKTFGELGDDEALNAQQDSGVNGNLELPVVWSVAKGLYLNKAMLVPAALRISAFLCCGRV